MQMKIEHISGMGLAVTTALLLVALLSGGCFRKHVVSTPPAQRPAEPAKTEPAPQPAISEETPEPGIIEETYVVDAPVEEKVADTEVAEGELAEEPVAEKPAVQSHEVIKEEVQTETVEEMAAEPVPTASGLYFVQIGAFSDLENANRALARLLADGYQGSKLDKTDTGLFRVQAGIFPDEASARDALLALQSDYPNSFIFKKD